MEEVLHILDISGIAENGMIKLHGLDDTDKIARGAQELAEKIGHRIVEVEVEIGSYLGVIYVIDPQRD